MGRKAGGGSSRYILWKGDEIVAIGTARQLAEKLGCSVRTIYWYVSPACKRRDNGNRLVAERI